MSITIQNLPRSTVYSMRAVSAANDLSPSFGGSIQRIARKGSRWAIDVSIPALAIQKCGMSLIADLVRGESQLIRMKLPDGIEPSPYGSPLVNGAGQSGMTLVADAFTPNVVMRKGKFFSVEVSGQGFVYMVTDETVASSGGMASLPIWPMLRAPIADNTPISIATPYIEGFIAPGQDWSISNARAVGLSFTIEERE
jgi:hypothetical protein